MIRPAKDTKLESFELSGLIFCIIFSRMFYLIKEISERKENEGLSAMELRPPEKVKATRRTM